jgi:hypothetical protein
MLLLILAAILLLLRAFGVTTVARVDLGWLGLAFYILSLLL